MDGVKLVLAVVVCELVGVLGALTTATGSGPWYQALQKPSFNPPGWVFGPVWMALYLMMGIAVFLVWRRGLSTPGVPLALGLFAVQLLLNASWTPVFFGLHSLMGGLVIIILLLAAIIGTMAAFRPISIPATVLMIPYATWVSFATVLNASIVALNR